MTETENVKVESKNNGQTQLQGSGVGAVMTEFRVANALITCSNAYKQVGIL